MAHQMERKVSAFGETQSQTWSFSRLRVLNLGFGSGSGLGLGKELDNGIHFGLGLGSLCALRRLVIYLTRYCAVVCVRKGS